MTQTDVDAIAESVVQAMKKALAPMQAKLQAIEQDVAVLKAAPVLKDAGVWRHGSTYAVGDVTTFKGSAWVCTKAHTADGPVADHSYWRLLVKGASR